MMNFEAEPTRHKVPESDIEYQELREQFRARNHPSAFGEETLGYYDLYDGLYQALRTELEDLNTRLQEAQSEQDEEQVAVFNQAIVEETARAEQLLKERDTTIRLKFEYLMESWQRLQQQVIGISESDRHIGEEFGKMIDDPESREELEVIFGEKFSGFTIKNMLAKITDGSISEGLILKALKKHVDSFEKQKEQLAKITERIKENFKERVREAVEQQVLPEEALQALSRLDLIAVDLKDRLQNILSPIVGSCGTSGRIEVVSELLQPELEKRLEKTLFHEFLHEISGKAITIYSEDDGKIAYHRRSGIALHSRKLGYSPNTWLDEAVTEFIAIKLSGHKEAGAGAYNGSYSYSVERKGLDILFALGLEENTIFKAYFENISSEGSEQGHHLQELVHRINEVAGANAFEKIENKYLAKEIEQEMYGIGALPLSETEPLSSEKILNAAIFHITVTIGSKEDVATIKKFVQVVPNNSIPVDAKNDAKARVEQIMESIKSCYRRKMSYTINQA